MKAPASFAMSRRGFLHSAGATTLLGMLPVSARAASDASTQTLQNEWLYRRGTLSPETARAAKDGWQAVAVPHCANACDACDPDTPYFQGQSWYKLHLNVVNPFARGRTLLRFRGAGQTTTVWAGSTLLGRHVGGYDEFVFDVTEAGRSFDLLVCCDNTPDEDRSPSNLSDFCLYGGLYRNVELIYLPALAVDAVVVHSELQARGSATISVAASLFGEGPGAPNADCVVQVEVLDPSGKNIDSKNDSSKGLDGC